MIAGAVLVRDGRFKLSACAYEPNWPATLVNVALALVPMD
jgi:hypothetical protein